MVQLSGCMVDCRKLERLQAVLARSRCKIQEFNGHYNMNLSKALELTSRLSSIKPLIDEDRNEREATEIVNGEVRE